MDIYSDSPGPFTFASLTDFTTPLHLSFTLPALDALPGEPARVLIYDMNQVQFIYTATYHPTGVGGSTDPFPIQKIGLTQTLSCAGKTSTGDNITRVFSTAITKQIYWDTQSYGYQVVPINLFTGSLADFYDNPAVYDLNATGRKALFDLFLSAFQLTAIDSVSGDIHNLLLRIGISDMSVSLGQGGYSSSATIQRGVTIILTASSANAVHVKITSRIIGDSPSVPDTFIADVQQRGYAGGVNYNFPVTPVSSTIYGALFTANDGTTLSISFSVYVTDQVVAPSSMHLGADALHRNCAVSTLATTGINYGMSPPAIADSPVQVFTTKDAGRTYIKSLLAGVGRDATMLFDERSNLLRIIYTRRFYYDASQPGLYVDYLMSTTGVLGDAFVGSPAVPLLLDNAAALDNRAGSFAKICPHPTDKDYALLAYFVLDVNIYYKVFIYTLNRGASWNNVIIVAPGLSGQLPGIGTESKELREPAGGAAIAFIGNTVFIAETTDTNILLTTNYERGMTWRFFPAANYSLALISPGSYKSLSMVAQSGRLYLLAFAGGVTPTLLVSADLGITWTKTASVFPAITPPTAIGISPLTGKLRLGMSHTSSDDGLTWIAN